MSGDSVTGLVEVYADKNAASGKTLSVSAYTVNDGNSGKNYTVTKVGSTTGVINLASLTIAALTNTKPYDSTTSASGKPSVFGLLGSDTVTGLAENNVFQHQRVGVRQNGEQVSAYTVNDGNRRRQLLDYQRGQFDGIDQPGPIDGYRDHR